MSIHCIKYLSKIPSLYKGMVFFVGMLILFHPLMAQKEDSLKTQEIIIQKIQQPTIADANKIKENPTIEVITPPIPTLTYKVLPKQIKTIFDVQPIAPAIMKGEPLTKFYKQYLKFGLGNNYITYGEAWMNTMRSRDHSFGVHLKHFASKGNVKDVGFSGYSDNEVNLYGKLFLTHHAVQGGISVNRNVIHYYGYNPTDYTSFTKDNTKQRYFIFEDYEQITSFHKDSTKLNHDIKLRYYYLEDLYRTSTENNILLTADFRKFFNNEHFVLSSAFDYNNSHNASSVLNNGIVKISPQIISKGDKWKAKVGIGIYADATHTAFFHFYPEAHFKYNVVADIIIPYVGLTGKIQRNSTRSFVEENPFLNADVLLNNSNHKLELYAGIRGTLSSSASFNLKVVNSKIEDLPLFVNDTKALADNKFMVIYDTATVVNLSGELSYEKTDKIKLLVKADYFIYDLKNELQPWQKPDYQLTLSGNYNLQNKIIVKADIFALSGISAKSYDATEGDLLDKKQGIYEKKLKGIIDMNLGIEYRYTKKFSAYINFNNLGATRYYRWNNYPTQRFNVLGGVTYSF